MRNTKIEGNIAMFISKTFSGLNANALKFLIPVWMSPLAGVTFRMLFGAGAFWLIDKILAVKDPAVLKKIEKKQILFLLLLGAFGFYVYQITYLTAVQYTTPVSVSILGSLMPAWTFLFGVTVYRSETFTWSKVCGLVISIGGAVLSMFAKRPPELASHPLLGDMLAIVSGIVYSLYLIYSKRLLKNLDSITMLKWAFTGAAIAAVCIDSALLWGPFGASGLVKEHFFNAPVDWTPVFVLLFILIFPTVISFLLLETSLKILSATVVASYNNVLVVVATVTSLILGQDVFSWYQIGSIALLFVGLYFIARPSPAPAAQATSAAS